MKYTYKLIDLFCGAGGLSNGFEKTGRFEVRYGIDNIEDYANTFKMNHKKSNINYSDIRLIKNEDIKMINEKYGPYDVVLGGPPCGGFSSIRPFRSINDKDPKNNLYEEFGRFIRILNPDFFVMENVVGLLTHRQGTSLKEIITAFNSLGFKVSYKVLNAVHYGVPQKRERLIIIGCKKGSISFPKPQHYNMNDKSMVKDDVRFIIKEKIQKTLLKNNNDIILKNTLKPPLTVIEAIGDLPPIQSGEEVALYSRECCKNFLMDSSSLCLRAYAAACEIPSSSIIL